MKRNLLIIVLLSFTISLAAQIGNSVKDSTKSTIYHRNNIYGTISYAVVTASTSISYETLLWKTNSPFMSSLWARGKTGIIGIMMMTDYQQYNVSLVGLTGHGVSHLEYNLGASYFVSSNVKFVLPTVALGYRYQKPDGLLMYRFGVGFPEVIYASVGLSF